MLVPLLIGFIIHASVGMNDYEPNEAWGEPPADHSGGLLWFQDGSYGILFPLLLPLVVGIFAAGAIGDEVEGKTLPYLFTRPIYRNWILLAKALGLLGGVYLLAVGALTVYWFGSVGLTESPLEHVGQLFGYWAAAALSVAATGGLFLLVGVLLRRGIILIGLYLFVWEFGLSNAPLTFIHKATIITYERALLLEITGRGTPGALENIGNVSAAGGAAALLVLFALGLLASLVVVSVKDYNV